VGVRGLTSWPRDMPDRSRSWPNATASPGVTSVHLIDLAFLSPRLVDAILQGRQPVALTATRLSEFDLPLDWAEQHKLLASRPAHPSNPEHLFAFIELARQLGSCQMGARAVAVQVEVRLTLCWSEWDSNRWSHPCYGGSG
jgi:hypothetical protein